MTALHTWNVFKRFRAGIYSLASLLWLGVAICCVIMLVNGWTVYKSHQKTAFSFLLSIDLISSISLILMTIFKLQPLADLVRVGVMLVFQMGVVVVFGLSMSNLPCSQSGLVQSCKSLESYILSATCITVALLFLFLIGLFPMLRKPLPSPTPASPLPVYWDTKTPINDKRFCDRSKGSVLTYASWDKVPENPRTDAEKSPYSQEKFAELYYFKLQHKSMSPPRPKHPPLEQCPLPRNPFLTPERNLIELSSPDISYTGPLTPMVTGPNTNASPRGSISSLTSTGSRRSSWSSEISLLEPPPPVVLASPKGVHHHQSRRMPSDASISPLLPRRQPDNQSDKISEEEVLPPSPTILLAHADLIVPRKPTRKADGKPKQIIQTTQPLKIKRKAPQQLSLDDHLLALDDPNFSAVPRSPSPISGPNSPNGFPITPNSGALPSHPRLTMHFRELKLARSSSSLTVPTP